MSLLERGAELLGSLGIFLTIGPLISTPFWYWAAKRWGKRNAFMGAALLNALVVSTWLLSGPDESMFIVNLRVFCVGLAVGGITITGFSLLPDTIEYDRLRSGMNREGVYSGIYSTIEKATSAFGPLIFSAFLAANGFISSRAGETVVQPEATLTSIYLAVGLIPAVASLAAAAIMILYNLDQAKLESLQQE